MEEEVSEDPKINDESLANQSNKKSVGQEQIHDLLFGEKLSWQSLIYDLINSEQLDPWDVDISVLSNKYLEKIRELEGHNFVISSKVLLAAALLLRIKSEILLHRDIPGLDEILFGKKEEKKYVQERIELEDDIPGLVPRTPLPRYRKVTLQELMSALGKAIKTETRRIKKVVVKKQHEMETSFSLPKKSFNLKDKIKDVYSKIQEIFTSRDSRLAFSEFVGVEKDERIATFIPLLHLDNQQKVWLEQDAPFDEIWIWLKKLYDAQNKEKLDAMMKEVEKEIEDKDDNMSPEQSKRAEKIKDEFEGSVV